MYKHTFLVCPLPTELDGLLGTDFLDKAGAVINVDLIILSLASNRGALYPHVTEYGKHAALTVFHKERQESDKPLQKSRGETSPSGHSANGSPRDKPTENNKSWLVKMARKVTVVPRNRHMVTAKLDSINKPENPPLVSIEPATVPIQGIFEAQALSRIAPVERDAEQLTLRPAHPRTDSSAKSVQGMLTNFSLDELTLPKATVLGIAEEISEKLFDTINTRETENVEFSTKQGLKNRNGKLYQKLLVDELDKLAPREKQLIEPVLKMFAHVFHDEDTNDFKSTNAV
jgi:hypothetical protein